MRKKLLQSISVMAFATLSWGAFACDGTQVASQLHSLESSELLKNPTAFAHGWQDGDITLKFEGLSGAENCTATMQLNLPQRDLDEVNAHLDQNPAKRILLGAQGYQVPDSTVVKLTYQFALENGQVASRNQGNKALSDLHSSLEFMYQLLTQLRAEVKADGQNTSPWPDKTKSQWLTQCQQAFTNNPADAGCACKVENLAKTYTARQMELIEHLQSHPYSATSAALIRFKELDKGINKSCGLSQS